MRIAPLSIFLGVFLCLVFFANFSMADANTEAVKIVSEQYKKYGRNISPRSIECIYFNADGMSPEGGVNVSARELHSSSCGGDPTTTKMIGSFVVKDGVVYVEDIDFGTLATFDEHYRKPQH